MSSHEFSDPEDIRDEDFLALLSSSEAKDVELNVAFPVTLSWEWVNDIGGPELAEAK